MKQLFLLLFIIPLFCLSQNMIEIQLNENKRPIPKTGLNGNTIRGPSWINTIFNDSVKSMGPDLLRYPGGNVSNYWDWETGWFFDQSVLDTILLPDTILSPPQAWSGLSPIDIRPTRFHEALNQIDSKGIFVLNMMSSSLDNQISSLQNAIDSGIILNRIELGSEFNHNNPFSTIRFPTAGDYARECNTWIDSVKGLIPNTLIGVVAGNRGSEPSRAWRWNDSICSIVNDADALIWHLYLYLYDTDTTFTDKQVLAYPFYRVPLYEKWRGFQDTTSIIQNHRLWVTEYNLFDKTTEKVFTNTWAHVLLLSGINHNLLNNNLVDIMIQHNVSGIFSNFDAIDTQNNFRKRSSGYSSSIWNKQMKNMNYAQKIIFNSSIVDSVEYQNNNGLINQVSFPKVFGWKFSSLNQEKAIIVNISNDTIIIDASSVLPLNSNWICWTSDSIFAQIENFNYINNDTLFGNQNISLPPYSISTSINLCYNDVDMDLICDELDNCVSIYNPSQNDFNDDGIGDDCDDINLIEPNTNRRLFKLKDLMGRDVSVVTDFGIKVHIYDDGTVEKKLIISQ